MACIDIEVDFYLDEASTSALRSEVNRRIADGSWKIDPMIDEIEPWTPQGMAADLRSAFYRRDASRFELLLKVLEPRQKAA